MRVRNVMIMYRLIRAALMTSGSMEARLLLRGAGIGVFRVVLGEAGGVVDVVFAVKMGLGG